MNCKYPFFNIYQNTSMYHFTSISPSHLCSFSVYCLVWRILSRSVNSSLHNKLPTLVQQGLTDMPLACEDGQPVEAHQVILTLFSRPLFPSYLLPLLSKPKITNLKELCPTQCSVVCMTLPHQTKPQDHMECRERKDPGRLKNGIRDLFSTNIFNQVHYGLSPVEKWK